MPDKEPEIEVVPSGNEPDRKQIVPARMVFPNSLPIIPLTNRPIFPKMMVPLVIEEASVKAAISEIVKLPSKFVGLILVREPAAGDPPHEGPFLGRDLFSVGVIAEILQANQTAPDAPIQIMVGVLERFTVSRYIAEQPHLVAAVDYVFEGDAPLTEELKAFALSIISSIKDLIPLNPLFKEELNLFLTRINIKEPGRLADFAAAMTTSSAAELQDILEAFSLRHRLEKVLYLLKKEVDLARLQNKISKQIEEKLSKQQREFFLREQLKAIKKELGLTKEGKESELDEFRERLKKLTLSDEARERIEEEMNKLSLIEPASPEFHVSRNYLDWLTALPWGVFSADSYDLKKASRILNQDHYGLKDVKERILEFLSVGILKGNISGSIILFVGPPGVGKTSIGQSIARSINRNFYRFSLGGMRDEAEIKGHRRTYIGALPGKFIQAIKVCKSANPIIMLDEIDKIGASFQGDPASALLEVLDPEQNRAFLDHYLDVRFDLSHVLFICTANQTDTIPPALLDRMEVIKLSGYILEEKLQIARKFLIPKQLTAHGLKPAQLQIADPSLREIIDGYAREPGIRGLENHIKRICRKSARKIVGDASTRLTIKPRDIPSLLGRRLFSDTDPFQKRRVGVITGLAWTNMGGVVLHIEAGSVSATSPGFKQTGQLGQVMVESSEIAYTYIRSYFNDQPKILEFFQKHFIHLHVPAGATPKDGPSAGITMAAALYSLATHRAIKPLFAMTGELSLSGLVMPIGGLKEKAIAAKRAGLANLVFPAENKKDFDELPAHIRKGLKPRFVATFPEVIQICFTK
jgi:ATP-dependent Lon protease